MSGDLKFQPDNTFNDSLIHLPETGRIVTIYS